MRNTFEKLLKPIYRRIRLLLRRGVLTGSNDAPMMRVVQVQLTKDVTLEMEHPEPYGFSSRALDGAEPIVGNVEGKSHPVALVLADRRYRIQNMAKGEVAIFDDQGQQVYLTRTGIVIKSALKVTVDAPMAEFTGDVDITGEATIGGIDFSTHVHGGVASGGSNTDGPQ